ncbi:ankyrin repeat domain-containing protein [Spirulina subsalsa]|uniref:ankyrin repeat domain-containing protein n=1 Tax=Spirulina subsalsa TaxID=54311 RepID=UPI0002EEBB1D|nr:ankyrin repeat domain-containing protein [Spirulina subsalsa]
MQAQVANRFKVGQTILDLYRVKTILGEGGLGTVYQVHHEGWNQDLILKVPHPDVLAGVGGLESLQHTTGQWVDLGLHPHLVSCFYGRVVEDHPLIFTEAIGGGTLEQWISQERLYHGGNTAALKRIFDIGIQCAWALDYAHSKGLKHQNFKPSNVLLTSLGTVKVTDWGWGNLRAVHGGNVLWNPLDRRANEDKFTLTPWGGWTPAYCSPEQERGEAIHHQTDFWSWGLMVLEMFQGGRNWNRGAIASHLLHQYLQTTAPSHLPLMPEGLVHLLRHCFQEYPGDRPYRFQEVAGQLMQIYQAVIGTAYPRQALSQEPLAEHLNNRALALLDLGETSEALQLWDQALRHQPGHPESVYNCGLLLWRMRQITDATLLEELAKTLPPQASWLNSYLWGCIHWERDDCESALQMWGQMGEPVPEEVQTSIAQAQNRLSQSKRLCPTPLGQVRGQSNPTQVNAVCFSQDGRYGLAGKQDGTMELWDFQTHQRHVFAGEIGEAVQGVSITPDNRYVLSVGSKMLPPPPNHPAYPRQFIPVITLKVWSLISGKGLCMFEVPATPLEEQVSPRGELPPSEVAEIGEVLATFPPSTTLPRTQVLAASADGRYELWQDSLTLTLVEVATGQTLYMSQLNGDRILLTPQGRYALTVGETIKLWKLETGQCVREFDCRAMQQNAVCIFPNGRYFIAATVDYNLEIWSLATGRCLRTLKTDRTHITALTLSADGRYLVTAGQSLKLWSVETGRCLRTFSFQDSGQTVAISPDGHYALVGGMGVQLWQIHCYTPAPAAPLRLCTVHPTANLLSDSEIYEQELAQAKRAFGQGDTLTAVQCLRRARSLPGYRHEPRSLALWTELYTRLPRGPLQDAWEAFTLTGHYKAMTTVAFSADSQWLVSGSSDRTLKLWNVATGEAVRQFYQMGQEAITIVQFSPDGQYIFAGTSAGKVHIWEIESGICLYNLTVDSQGITALAVSPDGLYLMTGGYQGRVQLWEIATGRCLRTFSGHQTPITAVQFSPDGQYCISSEAGTSLAHQGYPSQTTTAPTPRTDGSVALALLSPTTLGNWQYWQIATGESLQTVSGLRSGLTSVTFSPDGNYVVSASTDHTLSVWAVRVGRKIRTLYGHEGIVTAVAFSPDGHYLLSGSLDQTLRLWNTTTGLCLRTFEESSPVLSVAFSRDGRYGVAARQDGTGQLWMLDWDLIEQPRSDWDERARPYLENFLTLHTPYAGDVPEELRADLKPSPRVYQRPVGFLGLLFVIAWACTALATEVFSESAINASLLALGMAGSVAGYFFSRQVGNPTLQLGSLFGAGIMIAIALMNAAEGLGSLAAALLGAIAAYVFTGLVLVIKSSNPASVVPGIRACQNLKAEFGKASTALILLSTLSGGMVVELLLDRGTLAPSYCAVILLVVLGYLIYQGGKVLRQQGKIPLSKISITLLCFMLALLSLGKWALPSAMGRTPSDVCHNLTFTQDYLDRAGRPNATVTLYYETSGGILQSRVLPILQCAVENNNLPLVQLLLKRGADPNQPNPQGQTALHKSVERNNLELTQLLLDGGATVNVVDQNQQSPLYLVQDNAIAQLLIQRGADVNLNTPNGSILHRAIAAGNTERVKMLIEAGASPNVVCSECLGTTPLHAAIRMNRQDLLDLLLTQEADFTIKDQDGNIPLALATKTGRTGMVQLLLSRGAPPLED